MILCISVLSVVISPFAFLILLIWFFSLCFLMSLANGLSILFIFLKNQLLALLIFAMVSFVTNITKEIKICIETNENENTTTQNLWNSVKAVLKGRFLAIQAYLNKQEKHQINDLTLHLKQLEKEEMENPWVSRRKEFIKIRAEIEMKKKQRRL